MHTSETNIVSCISTHRLLSQHLPNPCGPVLSYTAWWPRHIGVNNLPKVVMQLCPGGNWTHNLLIASRRPYCYATVSQSQDDFREIVITSNSVELTQANHCALANYFWLPVIQWLHKHFDHSRLIKVNVSCQIKSPYCFLLINYDLCSILHHFQDRVLHNWKPLYPSLTSHLRDPFKFHQQT